MKTCPVCGKEIDDAAAFCPHCGSPAGQQGPVYAQPAGAAPAGPETEPPAVQLLRRMATSPVYLAGAIGYSCTILFNVITVVYSASPGAVNRYLTVTSRTVYGQQGELDTLYNFFSNLFGATAAGALLGSIPTLLMAVGIWMVYASARSRSGPISTAGLTIIRVIQIITAVLVCLLLGLVLGVIGLMLVGMPLSDNTPGAVGLLVAAVVTILVVFGLVILYYLRLIATIDCFRYTLWNGTPQGKISRFVAVIAILSGVFSLLGVLTGGIFPVLTALGGAVVGISFGVLLFRCRSALQCLQEPESAWQPNP